MCLKNILVNKLKPSFVQKEIRKIKTENNETFEWKLSKWGLVGENEEAAPTLVCYFFVHF